MAKKLTFATYDARRMFFEDITSRLAEIKDGICKKVTERYLAELPAELVEMFKECPKSFTVLGAVDVRTIIPLGKGDAYDSLKLEVPKGPEGESEKIITAIIRDTQFLSELEKEWEDYKRLSSMCQRLVYDIGKFLSYCNSEENLRRTYPELYNAYVKFYKIEKIGKLTPCDDIERVRAELSGITTEK